MWKSMLAAMMVFAPMSPVSGEDNLYFSPVK